MAWWHQVRHLVTRWREPRQGLPIRSPTTLAPGTYTLPDPGHGAVVIAGDALVLDGQGAVLDGGGRGGIGIVIVGRQGVTLRNLTVRGYDWAVLAIDCQKLLIEDCNFSHNGRSEGTFLDINRIDEGAGGGVRLLRSTTCTLTRIQASFQDIGIDAISCQGLHITHCDFSHNSAWGIRLHSSCDNRIEANRAHHVNRCEGRGCDSAGILVTAGSHRNRIIGNDLRWSGDGFFLGNQFSPPSNENLVVANDGSYSPNNAFEATFSQGNVFRRNRACWSNYGFWLGFSTETLLEENLICSNTLDGVHWEHGARGILRHNLIAYNGRYGAAFTLNPLNTDFPNRCSSTEHELTANDFVRNGAAAVYLLHTTKTRLVKNRYRGESHRWLIAGESSDLELEPHPL